MIYIWLIGFIISFIAIPVVAGYHSGTISEGNEALTIVFLALLWPLLLPCFLVIFAVSGLSSFGNWLYERRK